LLWANILSPLALIAKNGFVSPFSFSPIGTSKYECKIIPIEEWCGVMAKSKLIPIEWSGSLVFAKDSIFLSIYDLA
jgi:hypothetical protein